MLKLCYFSFLIIFVEMSEEFPEQIDLRAHHLYTLEHQRRAPRLTRLVQGSKIGLLGYNDEYAEHQTDVIGAIISGQVRRVRIVGDYDEICKKCPKKKGTHCEVAGREFPSAFLSEVDQKMAENSGLEIGSTYESGELISRMWGIRMGLVKTFLQLRGLLRKARSLGK